MTSPNTSHPGGAQAATGTRAPEPAASFDRRQEILTADPYYPHTWKRAIGLWTVTFFGFLGLAALLTLVWPDREFEWFYVFTTGMFATAYIGFQFLARKSRVSVLETAGKIARSG